MKKLIITGAVFLSVLNVYSQSVSNSFNGGPTAEAYDVSGRPLSNVNKIDIDGSPMLSDTWGSGIVKFEGGKQIAFDELQFSLFENELRFRKNKTEFAFADPVKEFKISYTKEGESMVGIFRNGYPDNSKKTIASYYQVLADGNKLHLLKYSSKSIQDNYSYGGPMRKIYKESYEYFLYDAKNETIKPVKFDKASLTKALPDFENAIDEFSKTKKNKLRTEADAVELLNYLNQ